MKRKILSYLLCIVIGITLTGCRETPQTESQVQESEITEVENEEYELQPETESAPDFGDAELNRAYSYGIFNSALFDDLDRTVRSDEMYQAISNLLNQYGQGSKEKFDSYLNESIQEKVDWTYCNVMQIIYLAAFSMNAREIHSGFNFVSLMEQNQGVFDEWDWGHIWWDQSKVSDEIYLSMFGENYKFGLDGCAYFYCVQQTSGYSGQPIITVDDYNFRFAMEPCTVENAIRAVTRLYEIVMPSVWTEEAEISKTVLDKANERKESILQSETMVECSGTAYYVAVTGDDGNDGKSTASPWKSLQKVATAGLKEGDVVYFNRGDVFRGSLICQSGVTYSAYGTGDKPVICASTQTGEGASKWNLYYEDESGKKIWKFAEKVNAIGNIWLNDYESCSDKLLPRYKDGEVYAELSMGQELLDVTIHLNNLSFYSEGDLWAGQPDAENATGDLYFRCDEGNPGEVYSQIEFTVTGGCVLQVQVNEGVVIDNLCFRQGGGSVQMCESLTIQNCEIAYLGGHVCSFDDAGFALLGGDGINIGGSNNTAVNNYIHDCYDYGITMEKIPESGAFINNRIEGNLVEHCNGGIMFLQWFGSQGAEFEYQNIDITDNMILYSGDGWGFDRHNAVASDAITGTCGIGTAGATWITMKDIEIKGNTIYLSKGNALCFPLADSEYPIFEENTYVISKSNVLAVTLDTEHNWIKLINSNDEETMKAVYGNTTDTVFCME